MRGLKRSCDTNNTSKRVLFYKAKVKYGRLRAFDRMVWPERKDVGLLIRMLQAVGVISLVSTGVFFTHLLVPRSPNAQKIERSPGLSILEQFRRTGSGSEKGGEKARTPLVVQAKAFALYLNPPKRKEISAPRSNARKTVVAVRTTKSKPKFVLAATSYYQSRPEKSMGLVLEPGSGYRWVKQGERVWHFVVERVEPGLIAYRNGDQLLEMAVKTDITPEAGRTTVASSQASTALFAISNTQKPNSVTVRLQQI